jgi:AcrR family transcriptional regulator
MAAAPTQERERADAKRNRMRILCAAARLVDERGIDCVSMDDVATAAGVGKGTLYRRFGDRASLLRALIDEPEREFQEAIIRGEPPLGPGAPPGERLLAFGSGLVRRLEQNAPFIREAETFRPGRYVHPVYAFYRTHLELLLREHAGDGPPVDYLADCLLAPLGAEPFLYQRELRGMSVQEIIDGWCTLAEAILEALGDHS